MTYQSPYPPVARRRSATKEGIAARRTEEYPPANPHRVGHIPGLHPEDAPEQSGEIIRPGKGKRQPVAKVEDDLPDDEENYDYAEPPRRGRTTQRVYQPVQPTRRLQRTRFHWLVFVGIGLFMMIVGWVSFSALSSWWSVQVNDWTYGRPRTYQTDVVVGHGDSTSNPSHFIAVNLNRKIIITEIPGGDVSKTQIYYGPLLLGDGEDLTPVTLSFGDTSGNGKLDMIVHVGTQKIIFTNNGQKFLPPQQH